MNELVEKPTHRSTQSNIAEYSIILAQSGKFFSLPYTRLCEDRYDTILFKSNYPPAVAISAMTYHREVHQSQVPFLRLFNLSSNPKCP